MNAESATPNWYVVQTQPRRELLAATALETSLDLDVFLPEVEKRIQGQKRKTAALSRLLLRERRVVSLAGAHDQRPDRRAAPGRL